MDTLQKARLTPSAVKFGTTADEALIKVVELANFLRQNGNTENDEYLFDLVNQINSLKKKFAEMVYDEKLHCVECYKNADLITEKIDETVEVCLNCSYHYYGK